MARPPPGPEPSGIGRAPSRTRRGTGSRSAELQFGKYEPRACGISTTFAHAQERFVTNGCPLFTIFPPGSPRAARLRSSSRRACPELAEGRGSTHGLDCRWSLPRCIGAGTRPDGVDRDDTVGSLRLLVFGLPVARGRRTPPTTCHISRPRRDSHNALAAQELSLFSYR